MKAEGDSVWGFKGFVKAQALGNDFIIVDGLEKKVDLKKDDIVKACDRRYGIGADGILVLEKSAKADLKMRIFNADGSEAQMCGNGVRCLAVYADRYGLCNRSTLRFETIAGDINVRLIKNESGGVEEVQVDMGIPVLERAKIPMKGPKGEVTDEPLTVGQKKLLVTCISMGNPHCVVFVNNVEAAPVDRLGPMIENLPVFPERTNVEFVEVTGRDFLKMRVWERGAGETSACGTGAAASLVAAARCGLADRKATVSLNGGSLMIEWKNNGHVHMTGPAELVFEGLTV
jgi:diaminopimelate epimerase